MINYGIVYGLSDFGLADRLGIPREEAKAIIDAYLERFPAVRRVHRGDDRQRHRERLRDDAVGPAPPDPRAQGAQLAGAHARRAPGGQHGHPGHGGRRHEARDGARRRGAARLGGAADPAPSTTSCSSRARPTRSRPRASSSAARWCGVLGARPAAGRRHRGRGRPGWRRSEHGPRRRRHPDGADRRARRAAGADQLDARPRGRDVAGGVRCRSRSAPSRWPCIAALATRRAGPARRACGRPLVLPDRRPARRGIRQSILVTVRTLGAGGDASQPRSPGSSRCRRSSTTAG